MVGVGASLALWALGAGWIWRWGHVDVDTCDWSGTFVVGEGWEEGCAWDRVGADTRCDKTYTALFSLQTSSKVEVSFATFG